MCALRSGRAPLRRHDGSAFSSKEQTKRIQGNLSCRAALLQVRGDWEWLVQAFRLRHYSAESFCWMCDACHTGPMSYLGVAWRTTLVDHAAYLTQLAREARAPSQLFGAPGFRYEYLTVDSMHCIDLGIFADAAGGLLFLELSNKTLHRTYQDGIDWLNGELDCFYSVHAGLSQVRVTLPAIRPTDGGYPSLKAKAAACRHLGLFLVYLAQRHQRIGYQIEDERLAPFSAEYQQLAVQMANFFVGYHRSCDAEPFSVAECRGQMLGFLDVYNQLRLLFRRGVPLGMQPSQVFGVRPKFHMADHMVQQKIQLYGSPRHFWCYGDEDFVGLVKRICAQTRHPRTMEARILSKYRLYAALHAHALSVMLTLQDVAAG